MPKIPINLGLGSYESISSPVSSQRCVNQYAGISENQALGPMVLYPTPGTTEFANVSNTFSRGDEVMDGVYYCVNGTTLYKIDSSRVVTALGTIPGVKRVLMADNGTKLAILAPDVATNNLWEYDSSTGVLTRVTDADYRTAQSIAFNDGYFCLVEKDSNVFFTSNLNQPLVYTGTDFTTCDLAPDKNVSVFSNYHENEVYVLGVQTTEVYQNIGGTGFPYQRIPGASFEKGSHSKYVPIQWGGLFYFLGGGENERTSVYQGKGGVAPVKVSTDAIDNEIQKFTEAEIAESFPFTFAISGHAFVGFTIRSQVINARTFVYNVTASMLAKKNVWFDMQSGNSEGAWRANGVRFIYDKLLVSDSVDGRIGELSADLYTEYGDSIVREKVTPPVSGKGKSLKFSKLELTVDSGQGLISGQGSDPQVMMQYSDDGARTWSNEFWRSLGKIGEYGHRVLWRRLGRCDENRVFRFRVTDPVKVVFIKASADITVLR
jgi:stabilization protein